MAIGSSKIKMTQGHLPLGLAPNPSKGCGNFEMNLSCFWTTFRLWIPIFIKFMGEDLRNMKIH